MNAAERSSEWQAMRSAPKDGRVVEAMSRDFGKMNGPASFYRARWFKGRWLNAETPREDLLYLFQWRAAPARGGYDEILDSLPLEVLAPHVRRGEIVELLQTIANARAAGQSTQANEAIGHLAQAVAEAQR